MKTKLLLASIAALAAAGAANAQEVQVSESDASQTTTVSTTIPALVAISGLEESIVIPVTDAAINNPFFNNITESRNFCVYSNIGPDRDYLIEVSSTAQAAQGRPFGMTGPDELGLQVFLGDDEEGGNFSEDTNGTGFRYMFPGSQVQLSATARGVNPAPLPDCSGDGGDNAVLRVRLMDEDILAVQKGEYSTDLTLTVSVL